MKIKREKSVRYAFGIITAIAFIIGFAGGAGLPIWAKIAVLAIATGYVTHAIYDEIQKRRQRSIRR